MPIIKNRKYTNTHLRDNNIIAIFIIFTKILIIIYIIRYNKPYLFWNMGVRRHRGQSFPKKSSKFADLYYFTKSETDPVT